MIRIVAPGNMWSDMQLSLAETALSTVFCRAAFHAGIKRKSIASFTMPTFTVCVTEKCSKLKVHRTDTSEAETLICHRLNHIDTD